LRKVKNPLKAREDAANRFSNRNNNLAERNLISSANNWLKPKKRIAETKERTKIGTKLKRITNKPKAPKPIRTTIRSNNNRRVRLCLRS
jgi:hypothetical protein